MGKLADGLVALLFAGLLVYAATTLRAPTERTGVVHVLDGDTLDLGGERIRLAGMDAPEMSQTCGPPEATTPCGRLARDALIRLIAGRSVTCRVTGQDRWRRSLASCTAEGDDLGAALVARGLAVAYGRYDAEERAAKAARVGLWAGPFERPADWRRRHEPQRGS